MYLCARLVGPFFEPAKLLKNEKTSPVRRLGSSFFVSSFGSQKPPISGRDYGRIMGRERKEQIRNEQCFPFLVVKSI